MNDERVFELLDECVAFAKEQLETEQELTPFAMYLNTDAAIESLHNDETDQHARYEQLHETLKLQAEQGKIIAVALLAKVTIPEHFSPSVSEGIRIHIEEKASSDNKLAGRFLYIPYQLYKTEDGDEKIHVHFHNPIPVGFPSEIFL